MNVSVSHMSEASAVRVKHEEEQPLQIKREPKAKPTLHLISAKKRKRAEAENGNVLFVESAMNEAAPSAPDERDEEPDGAKNDGRGSARQERIAWAPIRKKASNRKPVNYASKTVINTRGTDLYINLTINRHDKYKRADLQSLQYVKVLIKDCIKSVEGSLYADSDFMKLRDRIHEMEFYRFLSGKIIMDSKILEQNGLPMIFDGTNKEIFPWDIRADAEALWTRWMRNEIDFDLLRGIRSTKGVFDTGKSRTSYKLADIHKKKSAHCVGNNDLVNGQWWPSRMAALRDGAHGETEAGICGMAEQGAFSIVIANGGYNDRDEGESVEYCGTRSEDKTYTKHTKFLLDTCMKRQPLRVLRAVNKKSKYAPKEGIRYDGLYEITDHEIVEPLNAMVRFSLRRLPGQDPIRYQGIEVRPTAQELIERMTYRELLA